MARDRVLRFFVGILALLLLFLVDDFLSVLLTVTEDSATSLLFSSAEAAPVSRGGSGGRVMAEFLLLFVSCATVCEEGDMFIYMVIRALKVR